MSLAYMNLTLACLLFSAQFAMSKLYERRSAGTLASSLWMSVFNGGWCLLLFGILNGFRLAANATSLGYAFLFSLFNIGSGVCSVLAMKRGNLSTVTLYMLVGGLLIPFFYGILALNEPLTASKIAGVALMLLSFVPSVLRTRGEKSATKGGGLFFLLCAGCFLFNGLVSVVTSAHQKSGQGVDENSFMMLSAMFTFLLAGAGQGALHLKTHSRTFEGLGDGNRRDVLLCALIVGGFTLFNGGGNRFSLMAARSLEASIQFPIISASVIVLTALMGWACFKERLRTGDFVSIILAGAGIACFAL